MTEDADFPEFAATIAAVHTYYGKPVTPNVIDIYWNGLKGYELVAVKDALGRHVKNPDSGQFLPKVADVERMLGGTTIDAAQIAWTKVESAIRFAGAWYSVAFDDGLIHRVIEEMGGWIVLCGTLAKEMPFKQNEFVGRYRAYRARNERPAHAARLLGLIEAQNSANGYETKDADCLKLIGDPRAALLTIKAGAASARPAIRNVGEIAAAALAAPKESA